MSQTQVVGEGSRHEGTLVLARRCVIRRTSPDPGRVTYNPRRWCLANDPIELQAVDGPTNERKGDADAASWLPPNKSYRCTYVTRQVDVKAKYHRVEKDSNNFGRVIVHFRWK